MNFDNRSFRLNIMITAVVADRDFASQVERMLEDDFAKSRLMAPGEYDAKPWWFRFGVRLARLTAPVHWGVMAAGPRDATPTGPVAGRAMDAYNRPASH